MPIFRGSNTSTGLNAHFAGLNANLNGSNTNPRDMSGYLIPKSSARLVQGAPVSTQMHCTNAAAPPMKAKISALKNHG